MEIAKKTKTELENKIKELLDFCYINRIPIFVSAAIEDNGNETKYYNRMFAAKSHDIKLADDKIEKMVLVAAGFEPVPKREVINIDTNSLFETTEVTDGEE